MQLISFEILTFLISIDSIKDGQLLEMDVLGHGIRSAVGWDECESEKVAEICVVAYHHY